MQEWSQKHRFLATSQSPKRRTSADCLLPSQNLGNCNYQGGSKAGAVPLWLISKAALEPALWLITQPCSFHNFIPYQLSQSLPWVTRLFWRRHDISRYAPRNIKSRLFVAS